MKTLFSSCKAEEKMTLQTPTNEQTWELEGEWLLWAGLTVLCEQLKYMARFEPSGNFCF